MAKRTGELRRGPRRVPGWLGKAWTTLFWVTAVGVIAFSVLLTALRLWGLPAIAAERERIVAAASEKLGVPLTMEALRVGWNGINPSLEFIELRIAGHDGESALLLPRVEAEISWLSLLLFDLRLSLLQIDGPNLLVERDAQGTLSVAGIRLAKEDGADSPVADWLLRQHRVVITDGVLTWTDRQRGTPPLRLNDISFRLDNLGPWHRFALRGTPPSAIAGPIDLRGSLLGFSAGASDGWRGELFVDVDRVDLAAWQQWVRLPFAVDSGGAGIRAWVDIEGGRPKGVTADIRLVDADLRLADTLPRLDGELLAGRIAVHRQAAGFRIELTRLQLHTRDGLHVDPVDADIAWQREAGGASEGHVELARIDLGALSRVADHLPLDEGTRRLLADYQPAGRLEEVRASWRGNSQGLEAYSLRGDFDNLGLRAQGRFPGIQGMTGSIEANERWGRLFLRSGPSGIELPAVFPESLMAFDSLAGGVRWTHRDDVLEVELQALNFAGIDAVGTARGRYEYRGSGPGYLDLSAELSRAEAPAVWRYLPHKVPQGTRDWLHHALQAGVVDRAELHLEGDLAHFPFNDGDGTFLVTARVKDAILAYQPNWPAIEGLDADLRFAGSKMEIVSRRGSISGVPLTRTVVVLPDLSSHEPVLTVDGGATGPIAGYFAFLDASPVGDAIGAFYRDWKAEGDAGLTLALNIPLADAAATSVNGTVELREARLKLFEQLPPLTRVRGKLGFTAKGAEAKELRGDFLGAPVKVSVLNADHRTEVTARGAIRADAALRHYGWFWLPYLGGEANWETRVLIPPDGRLSVVVQSDLVGLSSSLPPPFNKGGSEALPLSVRYSWGEGDRLEAQLGTLVAADFRGRLRGRWQIQKAAVVSGEPLVLPEQGVVVRASLPDIDFDRWLKISGSEPQRTPADANKVQAQPQTLPLDSWPRISLRADSGRFAERIFHKIVIEARPEDARLKGSVEADEVSGSWAWRPAPGEGAQQQGGGQLGEQSSGQGSGQRIGQRSGQRIGQLSARLSRLHIPAPVAAEPASVAGAVVDAAVDQARAVLSAPSLPVITAVPAERTRLPDLDLLADDTRVAAVRLGRVELQARNVDADWLVDRFTSQAPDGEISASGGYYNHGQNETRLSVSVTSRDAGSMLERLGHGGALTRGDARLGGVLRWPGSVVDYQPAKLGGDVVVHLEKGRFRSIEHGGARLLGLLSLQNLPRRLLFDFGDVVSEGIAFDTIDGRFTISGGVMKTEAFQIDSPSGRVLMAGDIDLGQETQDLRLAIRPAVGSTVALGAAFVNPIAGVATLLAQKLLRDPLDKAFAVEYAVRGKWSEPQVERVGQVGERASGNSGATR